jgi:hypothetical protein
VRLTVCQKKLEEVGSWRDGGHKETLNLPYKLVGSLRSTNNGKKFSVSLRPDFFLAGEPPI